MALYQQEVSQLLTRAWIDESQSPLPAIDKAAQSIASSTTQSRDPSPGVCIWSTILAIQDVVTKHPTSIDFVLRIYHKACTLYPASVTNEYGSGEKAGIAQLRWWLLEAADCFNTVTFPNDIGKPSLRDKSALQFSEKELRNARSEVLDRITTWRERRTSLITSMAIMSRCFALNIIRESEGRQAAKSVSLAFERHSHWTEADFVANCILMRGCAKSLIETVEDGPQLASEWESKLRVFLGVEGDEGGQSFLLQHHASVRLKSTAATDEVKLTAMRSSP